MDSNYVFTMIVGFISCVFFIFIFRLIFSSVKSRKNNTLSKGKNKSETQKRITDSKEDKPKKNYKETREIIEFGSYPQGPNGEVKPIEWIVLSDNGEQKLLLSKYILDNKAFDDDAEYNVWRDCSLRKWLNNDFYGEAFSDDEKKQIFSVELATSEITNSDEVNNPIETADKIFLLSAGDVMNPEYGFEHGLDESVSRRAKGTDYAKKNGLEEDESGYATWYCRETVSFNNTTIKVLSNGFIDSLGLCSLRCFSDGVRPAVVIDSELYSDIRDDTKLQEKLIERLVSAIENNDLEQAEDSIKHGADVNCILQENHEKTYVKIPALIIAIAKGNVEMVRLLLKNGANPNCERIFNDGKRFSALYDSINCWPNGEIARLLIEAGADVNYINRDVEEVKCPILTGAISKGNVKMVRLLLESGADPNCERIVGSYGSFSALNDSIFAWPNDEIARLLVEAGADVNYINRYKEVTCPILSNAIVKGNADMVRLLLDNGADPNCKRMEDGSKGTTFYLDNDTKLNPDGSIPAGSIISVVSNSSSALFDSIANCDNSEIIEMLVQAGAEIKSSELNGKKLKSTEGLSEGTIQKLGEAGVIIPGKSFDKSTAEKSRTDDSDKKEEKDDEIQAYQAEEERSRKKTEAELKRNMETENNKTSNVLNEASYICEVEHAKHEIKPWQKFRFRLTSGYGWDYILSSAEYIIDADLYDIGRIAVSPLVGLPAKEYIGDYKENGKKISLIDELKREAGTLEIGGLSKALGGIPVLIIWYNQLNIVDITTPVDDVELMICYTETIVRRSFGTADALKKGNTEIKIFE